MKRKISVKKTKNQIIEDFFLNINPYPISTFQILNKTICKNWTKPQNEI